MKISKVQVITRGRPTATFTSSGRCIPPTQREWNEFKQPTRVYIEHPEETIVDNLQNRRDRPWRDYKPLVQKELRDAGIEGKVRWSQHAGCTMCPCSPGFILDTTIFDDGDPVNIYITFKE